MLYLPYTNSDYSKAIRKCLPRRAFKKIDYETLKLNKDFDKAKKETQLIVFLNSNKF